MYCNISVLLSPTQLLSPSFIPPPIMYFQIGILREYLALEMHVPNLPFPFDIERVIDDFVFMCFFVGECELV